MASSAPEAGGATVTQEETNGRAAVYLRVSTQEQAQDGISLAMQEKTCREAALQAGASTVEVFRDDGFTGRTSSGLACKRYWRACRSLIRCGCGRRIVSAGACVTNWS